MPRFTTNRTACAAMVRGVSVLVLSAVAAIAPGCSSLLGDKLNDAYCTAHPSDSDCRRAFPDAGGCTSNAQCSAPLAVCVVEQMTCVQCTAADHAACSGTTPVCSADNACRTCSAHTECPSSACLPDGSCGDDTSVAYVDPSGTGTTCTMASPCKKVSDALKTSRPFVKFQGTTNEQVTLNNTNVTFLADPDAKLTDTMMNGIILKIDGSSQVSIYDLEISGASGANNAGISLQPGNTAALTVVGGKLLGNAGSGIVMSGGTVMVSHSTLSGNTGSGIASSGGAVTVSNSQITTNTGNGIASSGGTVTVSNSQITTNTGNGIAASGALTVSNSQITTNTAIGISTNGGTATISQCTIAANSGGGLALMGTVFSIANNFIYRNGNTITATAGGVGLPVIPDASKFEFNTIVDNQASGGVTSVGGVLCDRSGFVAASNLIFRNTGGAAGNVQTLGLCTYGSSFVNAGASNVDNTPMFAHPNSPPFDYHLTQSSPTTIVDAAGTCTGLDFDADMRPVGAACDLGADERKP